MYQGQAPLDWRANFQPFFGGPRFRVDMFIAKRWESVGVGKVVPDILNLKGDWRGFVRGGWCMMSRACVTIDLRAGHADVHVNPSCMKNYPIGEKESSYWCNPPNEINSWFPFRSAVTVNRTWYRDRTRGIQAPMLHVNWSINDSALLGAAPLDGEIDLVPRTDTYAGHVKVKYEGYPSIGVYSLKPGRGVIQAPARACHSGPRSKAMLVSWRFSKSNRGR